VVESGFITTAGIGLQAFRRHAIDGQIPATACFEFKSLIFLARSERRGAEST
jgi:hypothetical protein